MKFPDCGGVVVDVIQGSEETFAGVVARDGVGITGGGSSEINCKLLLLLL